MEKGKAKLGWRAEKSFVNIQSKVEMSKNIFQAN